MSRKSITALFLVLLLMVQTLCPVVATAQGNWNDDCPVPHAYIVCTNCNTTADATCEYHEATCAEDGYYLHRCNNCGQLMNSDNGGNNIIGISRANKATGHDFEIVSTLKEGSCTVKGIYKLQCSLCGEVKYEGQYAHQFVEGVADATCTEPAMVGEVCELCGATNGDMTVVEGSEALGHDWVLDTDAEGYVAATCEEGGHNVYKCSRCDETMEEDVEALGHQWDDGEYAEPDCTHAGGVKYTCTVCGDTWVDEFTGELEEPALGHTEVEIPAVEPTCSEVGWTAGTKCSVCGEIITAPTEVPVNEDAHVAVLDKVLKEATCTTTGVGKYVCELCGENLGYRVIADGHKWDEGTVTKAATCGEDGERELTCSVCQETKTEVIPATGEHDFEESFVDATCTEPAKAGQVCKVCGATNGDMTVVEGSEALGHDWVLDTDAEGYVAATCEEGGHNVYKCSRCDETMEEDVEALGHQWDDGEYAEPDCTHAGGVKYTCTVCGDTWVDEFTGELEEPALQHTEEAVADVPATCTTPGWTGKVICSVCNEVLVEGEEIPVDSNAHVFEEIVIKPATCSAQGIGRYVCTECGYSTYKAIAVAHTWSEEKVSEDSTYVYRYCTVCGAVDILATLDGFEDTDCTANGKHTVVDVPEVPATSTSTGLTAGKKCSVCGEILEGCEVIPMLTCEHVPAEAVTEDEVPATCTTAGSYSLVVYCTVCNEEISRETVVVDALGHTEETIPGKPATCTEDGLTDGVKCSVCGDIIKAQETINALGHSYTVRYSFNEDYTKRLATYTCSLCGDSYTVEEDY